MADAGAVVAEALRTVIEQAKPGMTTLDLDRIAAEVLARHGASSPFLDYHPRWAPTPFPGVLCVSVNDAVVHGIPNDCVLADGDLVSVDFGATLRGWTGDAARSFIVGTPRDGDAALIEAADAALAAGIAAVRPGNRLGDVGHAISSTVQDAGFGLLADHGGHWGPRSAMAPMSTATIATGGRCEVCPEHEPHTANTPWPSPPTARAS